MPSRALYFYDAGRLLSRMTYIAEADDRRGEHFSDI